MPPRHRPERVCLFAQNVLHGAGQIRRAVVGGNDHHYEVVAAVDDGVLHVGLCLCKLSIVAVESHLVLLVGLEGVHDVLCLASGGLDGQHQTGVAVVVALDALVAGDMALVLRQTNFTLPAMKLKSGEISNFLTCAFISP